MTEAGEVRARPAPRRNLQRVSLRTRLEEAAYARVRERLHAAAEAARAGRVEVARGLCAATILRDQPLLAASPPLLRQAVATLLLSGGFGLLARLLAAVHGRRVRFRAGIPPPGPGVAAARRETSDSDPEYVLDPAWFAPPDADRVIRRWTDVLLARPAATGAWPGSGLGGGAGSGLGGGVEIGLSRAWQRGRD
ncbi:MAG: hypothetical protein KGL52_03645 [Rhodospirillales bacterium]|nr:hypothetical protein [Rhodospirillales bacterium]